MANRLKPHIDRHYRTNPSREQTGIIGKSFGGLISVYTAFLASETFGKSDLCQVLSGLKE
ncbi:alpha/beta hydrolase-fold protein [Bacillus licheniformis]|nr:alpha/beta hydrolase-fold protein [Bacillus licheniformis]